MADSNLIIYGNTLAGVKNKNVESVNIPEDIIEIGVEAFKDCFCLKEIVIPNSIQEIGESAFCCCFALESIVLPSKLKSIGERTFYGCNSLERIEIPDGVQEIGKTAFYGCKNLKSVSIPSSVSFINEDSFNACSNLKDFSIDVDNLSYIIRDGVLYSGNQKHIVKVFDVKRLTISKDVEYITPSALRECVNLQIIEVDECNGSFASSKGALYSKNLEKLIRVPSKIKQKKYVVEHSVREIWHYAFSNCNAINTIEMSNAVAKINSHAFENCASLQKIQLPDRLKILEESVFSCCENLQNITLPKELSAIEADAFEGCFELKHIEFNKNIERIGSFAFSLCLNLDNVVLPDTVTRIDNGAFNHCDKLKNVVLPTNLINVSDCLFRDCESLDFIELPGTIVSIGKSSFEGSSSLVNIKVPDGVNEIEDCAFKGCRSLRTVFIPQTVAKCGVDVLKDCPENIEITLAHKDPADVPMALFDNINIGEAQINVDKASWAKYNNDKRFEGVYFVKQLLYDDYELTNDIIALPQDFFTNPKYENENNKICRRLKECAQRPKELCLLIDYLCSEGVIKHEESEALMLILALTGRSVESKSRYKTIELSTPKAVHCIEMTFNLLCETPNVSKLDELFTITCSGAKGGGKNFRNPDKKRKSDVKDKIKALFPDIK